MSCKVPKIPQKWHCPDTLINSVLILWGRRTCKIKQYLIILYINWQIGMMMLYLVFFNLFELKPKTDVIPTALSLQTHPATLQLRVHKLAETNIFHQLFVLNGQQLCKTDNFAWKKQAGRGLLTMGQIRSPLLELSTLIRAKGHDFQDPALKKSYNDKNVERAHCKSHLILLLPRFYSQTGSAKIRQEAVFLKNT